MDPTPKGAKYFLRGLPLVNRMLKGLKYAYWVWVHFEALDSSNSYFEGRGDMTNYSYIVIFLFYFYGKCGLQGEVEHSMH